MKFTGGPLPVSSTQMAARIASAAVAQRDGVSQWSASSWAEGTSADNRAPSAISPAPRKAPPNPSRPAIERSMPAGGEKTGGANQPPPGDHEREGDAPADQGRQRPPETLPISAHDQPVPVPQAP